MKKTIFNSDWQNGFDACLSFGVIGVFIAQSLSVCLSVCLSVSLSLAKRFVFYQKKNEKQRGVPTQYLFYTQMTLKQSFWCSRWLVYKQLPSCSLTHCSQTPAAAPTKSFNYYILQNISVNWSSLCVVNQRFWGIHEILIKYSQSPSGYG